MRPNHNRMNIIAGYILTWTAIVAAGGVIGGLLYVLIVLMLAL